MELGFTIIPLFSQGKYWDACLEVRVLFKTFRLSFCLFLVCCVLFSYVERLKRLQKERVAIKIYVARSSPLRSDCISHIYDIEKLGFI